MPDLELSIVICSWNTADDLHNCLKSLDAVRDEVSFEVIVVDNNSEDRSPDMVEQEFKWVRLERMQRNLGFTGGNNHALKLIKGRHAFLLNSDTIVYPGGLKTLVDFVNQHPEAGIIGPKLLNGDGSLQYSCRRFPNPIAAIFRNTIFGRLFPNNKFTKDYLMQDLPRDRATEVDWVSGAALLARREFMDKEGFLDEGFFMYCEDTDWCYRCWEAGFKVFYVPSAEIMHLIGRSTDKAPNRMIGRHHKSMLLFYRKHMVKKSPAVIRPILIGLAYLALLLRAFPYFVKNKLDVLRRVFKR